MHHRLLVGGLMWSALCAAAFAQLPSDIATRQSLALDHLRTEAPSVRFQREGMNISRIYGTQMHFGTSARGSAESFVEHYQDAFAGGSSTFQFESAQELMDGRFVAVFFKQLVNNIPVDQAGLTILVLNQTSFPVVYANNNAATVANSVAAGSINAIAAKAIVTKAKPWLPITTKPQLVIHDGEHGPALAWTMTVDAKNKVYPESYDAFVDAQTGKIVEWRSNVHYVDVTGNISGFATPGLKPDQANNLPVSTPLGSNRVAIGATVAYTDANGNFTIPNAGNAQVTVNGDMRGRWVNVVPQAGAALTFSQLVTPPGPLNFVFNPAPSGLTTSQVNGLIHTNKVHDFVKQYSPTYPGVDIQIPCNVNLASTCNAYYQASTINFYQAGGGCPNTCYSTVLYHEYGHFIIAMAGTGQGAYGEGMGDVNASLLANTPNLGEDFQGVNAGPLRSCYNNIVYPSNAEIHTAGQIMSGAFWLTLDALKANYPTQTALDIIRPLFLESIRLRPAGISPSITIDVLTLDDNDGNLNNGTPHYSEIAQGFNAKNLTAPAIDFLTYRDIATPGTYVPFSVNDAFIPVTVQVQEVAGTLDPSTVKLNWRTNNGAWESIEMQEIIDPYYFYAGFSQPEVCGSFVEWYVSAKDTGGHTLYFPAGGPAAPRSTVFGLSDTVTLNDTFATDLGWTVANTALTTGAWVRNDPNGTNLNGVVANPENDSTDTGAFCLFTGQGTVGGAVGDQDVDGGPTRVVSPVINLSQANGIIQFQRWFFNDDGDDSMTVEISNDNGATWVPVSGVTYTGAGSTNKWVAQSFIVSKYVTPTATVRVRFSTSDNPNNSVTEAAIDAFVVRKIGTF